MSALDLLLDSYRSNALSERDKGTAFEKLVRAWLTVDPVQSNRFSQVELWSAWADRQGMDQTDTGIDLVATRHDGELAAIQCKFFKTDRRIRKEDIDSFLSASGKKTFSERVIVETTDVPWSPQAETMLQNQQLPVTRIGLQTLRNSPVDWSHFDSTGAVRRRPRKTLREDQDKACQQVQSHLEQVDRGKLIMACGTGKTLTSLRIAEDRVGLGGRVLFLVPSLALMSQTVAEWCQDQIVPITAFAVCSDTQVGRQRRSRDDVAEMERTDLAFPATTDPAVLTRGVLRSDRNTMQVVFSTYQSITVIEQAQAEHDLPIFDLIICDEAHRTTGATLAGEDPSHFVKVHDNAIVRGRKRLYMTATPRIYGERVQSRASEENVTLASMDDEELFGPVLYHQSFAQAVESDILTDYRVVVLAMDEQQISRSVQRRLSDASNELQLDDATRIIGCWKALSKTEWDGLDQDTQPMRRALAFCRNIASSKLVKEEFSKVVKEFQEQTDEDGVDKLICEVDHVDGTFHARERGQRLDWLQEEAGENVCRILSNARCLIEGVDVPDLDAILFLHPRQSQIEVVQAVGRVMRKAPGKKMGYVILPVGIPSGVSATDALNDNERYRVVWQILNALRSHDGRLEAVINQGGLGQNISDRIAVIAVVESLPTSGGPKRAEIGGGGGGVRHPNRNQTRESVRLVCRRRIFPGHSGEDCREVRHSGILGRLGPECRSYRGAAHHPHHELGRTIWQ